MTNENEELIKIDAEQNLYVHGQKITTAEDFYKVVGNQERLETKLAEKEAETAFMWRWIERGVFSNSTSPKDALDVLSYSDSAPWYNNRENWDTSHLEYDGDISEIISDKTRVKSLESKLSEALEVIEVMSHYEDWIGVDIMAICELAEAELLKLKDK